MLEKPELEDEKIIFCLKTEYGLLVTQLAFLPWGLDLNAAAYRVIADGETAYFLKLRRETAFDETSVALPCFLHAQGISQIIAPLTTQAGQRCGNLDGFKVILYPFVEGRDGYEANLSDRQWHDLGAVLRSLHAARLPPSLLRCLPQEAYPPQWRQSVRNCLGQVESQVGDDPIAAGLAAFLNGKRGEILDLVGRADRLAEALQSRLPDWVVCHSDIHAGNLLVSADGALYLVDWDSPILAPKERDLMSIGGGLMGNKRPPEEEEALFYQGYGRTQIDSTALAYYRYERIIEDIAVYCQQIFSTCQGSEDRERALYYLKSNFLPGQTIELAYRSDNTLTKKEIPG
jgi:spectinomycin phosphotransferase